MNEFEMIEQSRAYADDHESFDRSFIDSLDERLAEYGELTSCQYDALTNIYDKFRINKWFYSADRKEKINEAN